MQACLVAVAVLAAVAIVGPLLAQYDPNATVAAALQGPSRSHWLGTDELGRDILARSLSGMRVSLLVALMAVVAGGCVGATIGLYAGHFAGKRDSILMAIVDFMLAFPPLVVAMTLVAVIGAGRGTPIVASIFVAIPLFGRVVRGSTLAERNREYVLATRALGARNARVIFRTILPSVLDVVWAQAAIVAAVAVQLEAGLSFLGMGVPPPDASLGGMLQTAQSFLYNAPYYALLPGIILTTLIAVFIMLANTLNRDALV